jgi:hypothetical protein
VNEVSRPDFGHRQSFSIHVYDKFRRLSSALAAAVVACNTRSFLVEEGGSE